MWSEAVRQAELQVTDPFSLVSALAPALELRAWGLQGLPADTFSIENAIIIKNSVKYVVKILFHKFINTTIKV